MGTLIHSPDDSDKRGRREMSWPFIGLCVVAMIFFTFACMIPPVLKNLRRTGRAFSNGNQERGLHQACILHSQGNNGWFPGFDRDGNAVAPNVEQRFQIMIEDGHFSGEYMISPSESLKVWSGGPVTTANYSYTMLQLPTTGGRHNEWRQTNNAEAVVISDRAVPNGTGYKSVHTNPRQLNTTEWRGSVAWNDNHVTFEADYTVDTIYDSHANADDNLFASKGTDDAYMVYSGNE